MVCLQGLGPHHAHTQHPTGNNQHYNTISTLIDYDFFIYATYKNQRKSGQNQAKESSVVCGVLHLNRGMYLIPMTTILALRMMMLCSIDPSLMGYW